MALDRWIALIILVTSIVYGYAAYFTMDQLLPPFMQRNPVWPSTFPKILSVLAIVTSLVVLFGLEKSESSSKEPDIDYRRLGDYNIGQASLLIAMMVVYALTLRPFGFFIATVSFLSVSAAILGERKFHFLIPISILAAFVIWYLVEQVLGIFLRPFPTFLIGG